MSYHILVFEVLQKLMMSLSIKGREVDVEECAMSECLALLEQKEEHRNTLRRIDEKLGNDVTEVRSEN